MAVVGGKRPRRQRHAPPFDVLPLINRLRLECMESPGSRRLQPWFKALSGAPQTSFALDTDGEGLQRSKQCELSWLIAD